jgi:ferrochelatase
MKKTAVILLNLGGPTSVKEIYPFLFNLFYDKNILTFPNPFRYILAKLIAKRRFPEAQHIYAQLGGKSPLLENTKAQAKALQKELGKNVQIFVAMRHATPYAKDVLQDIQKYTPHEIVLLPLYPQYSHTTTGSAFEEWKKLLRKETIPTHFISSYPVLEGFLEVLKDLTLPLYQDVKNYGNPRVLFTAHGLPEKFICKGDPYQSQVTETANAFAKKLSFLEESPILCYQSRVGPLKWIGPSLESEIEKASVERRPILVVPISFVSEHSETLVELDITMRDLALSKGCPCYARVPTVGTHPLFIQGLVGLVRLAVLTSPPVGER